MFKFHYFHNCFLFYNSFNLNKNFSCWRPGNKFDFAKRNDVWGNCGCCLDPWLYKLWKCLMFGIIFDQCFWFLQSDNKQPYQFFWIVPSYNCSARTRFVFDGAGIDFVKTQKEI